MIYFYEEDKAKYEFDFLEKGYVGISISFNANGKLFISLPLHDGKIEWISEANRENFPLVSPEARQFVEKLAKNLIFM